MNIEFKKNTIAILSSILLIAFTFMAISFYKKTKPTQSTFEKELVEIETQSTSDTIESIEKDLVETDLENIDKELQDIEKELDSTF